MKKKTLLDSIDVPQPCDKSWDEMIGDDVSRFCLYCEKDIYNISAMTRAEAKKLLFQSKEKVCIRLERETNGRIKTLKKQLHQITRQVPLAAGVLAASLILSGTTNAQETETGKVTLTQIANSNNSKPTISGIITDSNGAIVAGIRIVLCNTKDGSTMFATSNTEGFYEFRNVEAGNYEIEIVAQSGFKELIYKNLIVENNIKLGVRLVLGSQTTTDCFVDVETHVTTEKPPIDDKITYRQIQDLPLNPNRNAYILGLFVNTKPQKQVKTSSISFTILDMNGIVIPDAEVKITNTKTQQIFIVMTNQKGIAYFPSLPRGHYDIKTSAQGFRNGMMSVIVQEKVEPNIELTLEIGASVGVVDINWFEVPIFNSIIQEDVDVIKKYVAAKKNVNIRDKFSGNKTMLHAAVQSENIEIIKLLLKAGADVSAKDKLGRTPLLMLNVVDEDDLEILKLFIAKGADLNVQDKDDHNRTLLMNFCEDNEYDAAKLLLEAGVNPNLIDGDGETAMHKTKSEKIKDLLRKYGAKP